MGLLTSCIKVVQDAMKMIGRKQQEVDDVLEIYVESFSNNLDLQKIGEFLQSDENNIVETLMSEFRIGQNWTEKMAGKDRKDGLVMDEAIYNFHIGNEDFYAKVSEMITEKIKNREVSKGKDKPERNRLFNCILEIVNKIKNTVKRKDVKMLPEATQDIKEESSVNPNTRNELLKSIKVSSKELAENIKKTIKKQEKNVQIKRDNKEGPNLDD